MRMVGDKKKVGVGPNEPSADENLPIAEPDAVREIVREVGAGPLSPEQFASPLVDATEASDPLGSPVELSSVFGEEVTQGQLIDEVSSLPPVPAKNTRGLKHTVGPPHSTGRQVVKSDPPESRIGTTLAGRYRLERVIAKGGMGRVYLATQLPLERQVAVKLLVNQRFDAEFRQRFFLEASTCARLVHRHIVTVHDYGEAENGELFMAMEYLDGIPLSKVIQKQVRLPSERACKIALQVCRALRTAHKTGVVHRDLKPGNVIVLTDEDQDGNDFIKVLDFGLVKAFEGRSERTDDLTKSGTWLGSPRYMAPEQIRCQPVDPRTDIYSLGVILFHMLAGRPPFVGANSMEVLEQHLRDQPPTIAAVLGRSDYAPELEVVVQRCLKKNASERYQSMDELINDLKASYRLITGISLHTESTLPMYGDQKDPSGLGYSSDVGRMASSSALMAPPLDTSHISEFGSTGGARITGTIRAPLELLEPSNPGASRPGSATGVSDVSIDSISGSTMESATSPWRWIALGLVPLLVMLSGFLAVRLLRPSTPVLAVVQVYIDSMPPAAEVFLDGRRLGLTPMTYALTDAPPGSIRTFKVHKDGYRVAELRTPISGERIDLHASLSAVPKLAPVPIEAQPVQPVRPEPPKDRKKVAERSADEDRRSTRKKRKSDKKDTADRKRVSKKRASKQGDSRRAEKEKRSDPPDEPSLSQERRKNGAQQMRTAIRGGMRGDG
ncbi:MAG: serine/threonine-protein kinase, partial [Myxococcota bacterium]